MKISLAALGLFFYVSTASASLHGDPKRDTVIIELNEHSKIVIITDSKEDLSSLEKYDINEIISALNDQIEDSVRYLEIRDGKVYVNEKEVEIENGEPENEEHINVKIGGIELGVDVNEIEEGMDEVEVKKEIYYQDRAQRTTHHFNVDIGINNWMEGSRFPDQSNAFYTVKPFGSWYVAVNSVNETQIEGAFFLEWGMGLSWYNWKFQDANTKISKGDERIEFEKVTLPTEGIKSKLTASYLNVHLVPMFDFSRGNKKVTSYASSGLKIKKYSRKGFRFGAGAYAGYRLGSHSKFRYREDEERENEKKSDNFYLQNFRYGLRAQVGWKGVEFFVLYDLNEVFAKGRGPLNEKGRSAALHALTFGFTL